MLRPIPHPLAVAIFAGMLQIPAQAALNAVDPGPYNLANGNFAGWYQDSHGRTLDLCLTKAVSSRVAGAPGAPAYMCTLLPTPGVFDDTQPIAFPTNFPDEAFWFTADAAIVDAARGIDLSYGTAIEAAFAAEEPVEGDQVSFARVRIRVDVPTAGTYVVTHPYGVEVFDVPAGGRRAINMTRDIGIAGAGDFSGALKGDVGPFLRSVNGPYTEGSERFIGDPNLDERVTGSPFNTNFVRIEGPGGIDLRTELFSISGKLSDVALPTPLMPQRTTYSRRTENGDLHAQQDVFVMAPPPPAAVTLTSQTPNLNLTEANGTGAWYAQSVLNPNVPTTLVLTADNSVAIPTSSLTTANLPLTDLVTITQAEYHLSTGQLTLVASTSDETSPPALTAHTGNGTLLGNLSGNGAVKTLSTSLSPIPPAKVQVTSANGGSDSEDVVLVP
ncbi:MULTISPECIES: hypothetical protein [Pseudomonas]|jgi:hypothetical protein|uniref:hypothetical protein n=1 Tax=Pseudomonas TaxID=286 RepID=UPI00040B4CBD|nr:MULTISPECIES: hypothetical protein [Pseudomonas]MDE4537354.1 hypothetical protein [Pseudomonas sp. ITEM 17296]USS53369.1 hypothetical protein NG836_16245 [Pseudomonas kermanshahensis]UVL69225.1 hypothetical protein LOY53_12320 [Pseudomonas sp. B21-031]SMF19393.1 hypothetical protein SAMN02745962_02194 [Pseudomonas sp. LAIL14HWK12:I11]SMR77193.1 hypothetical protein SAMN05661028_02699 [Pseudomonas sp. LAIL14HWK12:I10]